MADKKATGFVKLQIPAGAANPAPPVGPALGAQGVNIMQFCQAINAAAFLIKEKLGLKGGSGIPQLKKVGELTEQQLREIAEVKMPDLNANTIEAAMEIVAGTARSMGVTIEGRAPKKEYKITRRLQAILQGEDAE